MNFIVDTKNDLIRAQGVKFSVGIPQEQKEFWKDLENKSRGSVYSQDVKINYIWYESGKIYFGDYVSVVSEDSDVVQKEFKPAFYFCLKSYSLKSLNDVSIRAQVIVHDLRFLKVAEDVLWLHKFYDLWKRLAYEDNKTRSKAHYMFTLNGKSLETLKCAEKLYRAGFLLNASVLQRMLNSSGVDLDSSLSPHQILKVQKCVFDAFSFNDDLLQDLDSSYGAISKLDAIRAFDYGDIWSTVMDLNISSDFVKLISVSSARDNLLDLILNNAYDRKRLLEYIFIEVPQKQGFKNSQDITSMLRDYAAMAAVVDGSIKDKYPKYLKTEHDIMISRYNMVKTALEDSECMKHYEKHKWNWKSSHFKDVYPGDYTCNYSIVAPDSSADIVEEGKKMHHCVASYIPKIKSGKSLILFMRTYNPSRSSWSRSSSDVIRHLTIELYENKIVQARGLFNRDPDSIELRCLKEYCEEKNLEISGYLADQYKLIVGYDVTEPFDKGLSQERKELASVK